MTTQEKLLQEQDDWFFQESGIQNILQKRMQYLRKQYGDDVEICPYLDTMLKLAEANISYGWDKKELIELIEDVPEE